MASRYEEVMRQRALNNFNANGQGVADYSGPVAPGVGREAIDASVKAGETDLQNNKTTSKVAEAEGGNMAGAQMGGQMATQAAAQGNGMGTLGGGVMAAGAMTGNAPLMAAGLGLSVLGAGEQNKRNQEEAQRQAYNDRIKQRQMAMAQIASMGIQ